MVARPRKIRGTVVTPCNCHVGMLLVKELYHLLRSSVSKPEARWLRMDLVATIRASVILLEPFLDAVVAKYVLALRET